MPPLFLHSEEVENHPEKTRALLALVVHPQQHPTPPAKGVVPRESREPRELVGRRPRAPGCRVAPKTADVENAASGIDAAMFVAPADVRALALCGDPPPARRAHDAAADVFQSPLLLEDLNARRSGSSRFSLPKDPPHPPFPRFMLVHVGGRSFTSARGTTCQRRREVGLTQLWKLTWRHCPSAPRSAETRARRGVGGTRRGVRPAPGFSMAFVGGYRPKWARSSFQRVPHCRPHSPLRRRGSGSIRQEFGRKKRDPLGPRAPQR